MVDVHANLNSSTNVPHDWYVRSFGELYPLLYSHRDDAAAAEEVAAFAELLGLHDGERLLDICCGAGRHLAAIRQRGLNAWGVDLSRPLLRQAGERPEARGRLVRADLQDLPFADATFDAAVNLFNSFGYFLGDHENTAALEQMTRILRPGGRLLMDHMNPPWLRKTLEPYTRRDIDGLVVENHRRIIGRRVVNRIQVHQGPRERTYTESVRLYEPAELVSLFESAGLSDVRLVGDFDGRPLTADASRMIAIGVRA